MCELKPRMRKYLAILVSEIARPGLIVGRYGATGVVCCALYSEGLIDVFSGMLQGAVFT